MASLLKNNKGFKIIKMCWREYVACTDSFGLCGLCGDNSSEDPLYFIAVIDQAYCKTCFDAWYGSARRYSSEMEKEQHAFVVMREKLRDLGAWEDVPADEKIG